MQIESDTSKPYSKGEYNQIVKGDQWIRLTEGCPNKCPYCRESFENPIYKVYEIPKLETNKVKLIDMNLLCHKEALEIIEELGRRKVNGKVVYYEAICGIDYRFITQELATALKQARFKNLRIAWDWGFNQQKKIKEATQFLLNAGYSPRDITIFMVCNWKIPYEQCLQKLDLCKIWNFKVADCYFDNQLFPKTKEDPPIKPIHWEMEELLDFRKKCRKHNQLINFRIDPELDKKAILLSPNTKGEEK